MQPEKADCPIAITELGMVTDVKPVQPQKAEAPIDVTELPMCLLHNPGKSTKIFLRSSFHFFVFYAKGINFMAYKYLSHAR